LFFLKKGALTARGKKKDLIAVSVRRDKGGKSPDIHIEKISNLLIEKKKSIRMLRVEVKKGREGKTALEGKREYRKKLCKRFGK